MQITIELTAEQEAVLNYVAAKAGTPGKPAVPATERWPEIPAVPPITILPEDYLRARVVDLLASYREEMRADDGRAITEAFKSATEAERLAVFAALKMNRSSPATEK